MMEVRLPIVILIESADTAKVLATGYGDQQSQAFCCSDYQLQPDCHSHQIRPYSDEGTFSLKIHHLAVIASWKQWNP